MNAKSASALLVAVLLSSSAFVGAAAAEPGATLELRPGGPGSETATYVATAEVDQSGIGALDSFEMRLGAAGVRVPSVPPRAVEVAGIDRGADQPGTEVDVSVREELSGVSVHGDIVEVYFDGTNQLEAGDELVLVIEGVPTPPPGTHAIPVGINEPAERDLMNATVTVPASGDAATTAGGTATSAATEAGGDETGADVPIVDAETTTDQAEPIDLTSSPVPGFGPVAAAVAVLAAAACAARASRRR